VREFLASRSQGKGERGVNVETGPSLPKTPLSSAVERPAPHRPSRAELWLHRIRVLVLVFFCATVGVLLVILPWRPEWTDNGLLLGWPGLRAFMSNGFVRGLCSGLGLLDIWIGFWEAVHYHEGAHR
jgi:hypothetical protein